MDNIRMALDLVSIVISVVSLVVAIRVLKEVKK